MAWTWSPSDSSSPGREQDALGQVDLERGGVAVVAIAIGSLGVHLLVARAGAGVHRQRERDGLLRVEVAVERCDDADDLAAGVGRFDGRPAHRRAAAGGAEERAGERELRRAGDDAMTVETSHAGVVVAAVLRRGLVDT